MSNIGKVRDLIVCIKVYNWWRKSTLKCVGSVVLWFANFCLSLQLILFFWDSAREKKILIQMPNHNHWLQRLKKLKFYWLQKNHAWCHCHGWGYHLLHRQSNYGSRIWNIYGKDEVISSVNTKSLEKTLGNMNNMK